MHGFGGLDLSIPKIPTVDITKIPKSDTNKTQYSGPDQNQTENVSTDPADWGPVYQHKWMGYTPLGIEQNPGYGIPKEEEKKDSSFSFSKDPLDYILPITLGPAYMIMDTFTPGGAVKPPQDLDITDPNSTPRKWVEDTPLDLDLDKKASQIGSWWDETKSGIGSWFDKWKWWILIIAVILLFTGGAGYGLSRRK